MERCPDSLKEALDLRKQFPQYALSFSEKNQEGDYLVLAKLPELDLCFEDHGIFIFGLCLTLNDMEEYLEERAVKLKDRLISIFHQEPEKQLLGEILFPEKTPENHSQILSELNAALKTYDGISGRFLPFSALYGDVSSINLQSNEIPMYICILRGEV
ncbi:MAG: hypothetical protein WCO63_00720 [Bacteroidota bacterium]